MLLCNCRNWADFCLPRLEDGKFSDEGFITCCHLAVSTEFIIITRVRVIVLKLLQVATSRLDPILIWEAAHGDIEHCNFSIDNGFQLRFTVMRPGLSMAQQQQQIAQRALGLKASASLPWESFSAVFQVLINVFVVNAFSCAYITCMLRGLTQHKQVLLNSHMI